MFLPPDSVRGRVRGFIEKHAVRLGHRVIEVGSRQPDNSDPAWADNRRLASPETSWTGVDMFPGPGVDVVCDAQFLQFDDGAFTGAVCSEMLEHVMEPQAVMKELARVIERGGLAIVTTLTCFPIHGYPDDYWRFTPSGLHLLMDRAGFTSIFVETAGNATFALNDHGEDGYVYKDCPMHVFATGIKK